MSKAPKISLSSMLNKLQAVEHYKRPDIAFDVLLYGWRMQRKQSSAWLHDLRKRDLLSLQRAKNFAQYCLQNDWQKMMPD